MYRILAIVIFSTVECANYQRYGETTGKYPAYSTISNLYEQFPYKANYGSESNFPEVTRYPNYSPGYSTPSYNTYNTGNNGNTNSYYNKPGYGVSTPGYGQEYGGYSSYEMPFMKDIRDYCVNRSPQTGILVDNLMGIWYGVEFVQHLAGDSRVDYTKTCIVIHISEPMEHPSTENQLFHVQHINARFRQQFRHLRLLWDEAGQTIEYALYFKNDSAGYWQVYDGQNGTLTSRSNYQQFSGTIQVLKAVHGHLVLSFCQEASNGRPAQLYSVLFSRDPVTLARWEIESIHTILQNKKLSVASRRMVCGNSADKPIQSIMVISVLSCLLAYVIGSS
ncbi:uncharacterized protein LOC114364160 [Ostrinia furnacalis]|uniref:uncharacterized protein LOC114364160 n=1 Tax=Ostrinia furnacalis TaxID=93504 RepID=UPI00103A55FD|nr:uncharacterized protein LOC114364160 [Ostrinia furnacalis]